MFNWRIIIGLLLLVIGFRNFYLEFLAPGEYSYDSQANLTRIICLIPLALGCYLIYLGWKKR